jgi:cation:H+ antiporter
MFEVVLPLVGGLIGLLVGGELLVRGAVRVAEAARISPLVIGLTLVGFGTSTPELVASLQAGLRGAPGIAIGNVVGSNLSNILLILGLCAVVAPIRVRSGELRRDGGVMIAAAVAYAALGLLGPVERWMGGLLVAGLVAYLGWIFWRERHRAPTTDAAPHAPALPGPGAAEIAIALGIAVGGLALVIVGGGWFVEGSIALARQLGMSESVIGLTIVAIGTSMPELVTSVAAALRRQSDLAWGNVVGSNIYNILGIGGITALVAPGPFPPSIATFDAPLLVGVSVLAVGMAWSGRMINRIEGAILVVLQIAWMGWLLASGTA